MIHATGLPKWAGKLLRFAAVFAVVVPLPIALGDDGTKITVGHDTTRALGPLREDGTVDYLAALRELYTKGVTSENNAAPLLTEALGSDFVDERVRYSFLKQLGLDPTTLPVAQFTTLNQFAAISAEGAKLDVEAVTKVIISRPWKADEFPVVAAWLTKNAESLKLWEQAVERPRYYMPLFTTKKPDQLFALVVPGGQSGLATAASARATERLGKGDISGTWADVVRLHKHARLVSAGPTQLDQLFGIEIERKACNVGTALATNGKTNGADWRRMLGQLRQLPKPAPVVESIDGYERYNALDVLMMCKRYGSFTAFVGLGGGDTFTNATVGKVDYDANLRRINGWYDRVVDADKQQTFRKRIAAATAIETDVEKMAANALHLPGELSASLGDRVVALLLSSDFGKVFSLEARAQMSRGLEETSLALAAYKAEKGEYPDKLESLAPAYLEKIPDDLFIDKPLKYRRNGKGYLLYSIGQNMLDDAGVSDRQTQKDDLAVRAER